MKTIIEMLLNITKIQKCLYFAIFQMIFESKSEMFSLNEMCEQWLGKQEMKKSFKINTRNVSQTFAVNLFDSISLQIKQTF